MPIPIDLEAPPCPAPEPCPSCPGYDVRLEVPAGWEVGDQVALEIRPGWSPSSGELCAAVTAKTNRGAIESEAAALSMPPDCLRVPEADPSLALALGCLLLAAMVRR